MVFDREFSNICKKGGLFEIFICVMVVVVINYEKGRKKLLY